MLAHTKQFSFLKITTSLKTGKSEPELRTQQKPSLDEMHPEIVKEAEEEPRPGDREPGKSKQAPDETASNLLQPKSHGKNKIEKIQVKPTKELDSKMKEKLGPTDEIMKKEIEVHENSFYLFWERVCEFSQAFLLQLVLIQHLSYWDIQVHLPIF